jgi:hypothetical protein
VGATADSASLRTALGRNHEISCVCYEFVAVFMNCFITMLRAVTYAHKTPRVLAALDCSELVLVTWNVLKWGRWGWVKGFGYRFVTKPTFCGVTLMFQVCSSRHSTWVTLALT